MKWKKKVSAKAEKPDSSSTGRKAEKADRQEEKNKKETTTKDTKEQGKNANQLDNSNEELPLKLTYFHLLHPDSERVLEPIQPKKILYSVT